MAGKDKIPEIRFTGFTDAWEQRKLGDIVTFINGRAYSQDELLNNGKYKVLRVGNFYTNDAWYYSNMELGEKFYADNGDLLYTWSATFGPHIWHGDRVIYHYHIWKLLLSEQLDKYFAVHLLDNDKEKITNDKNGSTMVHITKIGMEHKYVLIPKVQEQKKIADLLDNLDNLITLHQRKYDKLVIVKKSMLEKMFPKEGANVPEIRFAGFTDAWERRKVTELGKIFIGLVTTMTKNYREDGTLLIRNSDIKDNHFEFAEEPIFLDEQFAEDNSSRKLKIGDVVTVHTGDVGTSAVITENEEGAIGFATINTRPNKEFLDSNYLSTYFNSDLHKSFAITMSTGDGRTNYNLKDFFELVVPFPKLEEQKKISEYFKHLDNLITLHQREIEKLKNIKQSLLEKMF